MWHLLVQTPRRRSSPSMASWFRHLGAFGLFLLAILDGSPVPTFAGPDILTAILAASHRNPWYEYAAVATSGGVIGAYLTFRLARGAGAAYLDQKFKKGTVARTMRLYEHWGTSALLVSALIPFPFPTSMLFAAAGISNYRTSKFLGVVAFGRGLRYATIALVADRYGRHFIRALRHPGQYWPWLVLCAVIIFALTMGAILVNRTFAATPSGNAQTAE
jgi:membrane protein YqaA with SNARE-associated domain